jgi:predicted nucleotidyltransferase
MVRPNTKHWLFPELRALLLKAYGPIEQLSNLLADEPGVSAAYLFGSWAARYEGQWGDSPADIDIIVVGDVSLMRVEELEAEAEDKLGHPAQITVVPPRDWRAGKTGFVRTVRQRPLVPILDESR